MLSGNTIARKPEIFGVFWPLSGYQMTSMGAGKSSDFHDWRYATVPPLGFGEENRCLS